MLQQNKDIWNNMETVTILKERFIFPRKCGWSGACNHSKGATLEESTSNSQLSANPLKKKHYHNWIVWAFQYQNHLDMLNIITSIWMSFKRMIY